MAKNAPTCRTNTAENILASHQNVSEYDSDGGN